jgi:hypothetical protein
LSPSPPPTPPAIFPQSQPKPQTSLIYILATYYCNDAVRTAADPIYYKKRAANHNW